MGAGGDSVAPPPLDNWVDPRSVARKERMERIAALKSRKAFLTRRLEQELRELCPPKKVRPFDPDILPTNEAIIWHRDHLIKTGGLTENTPNQDKIVGIALDLLAVWEPLETPNRPLHGVRDKVKAVLKKWRDLKGRGGWSDGSKL